MHHRGASLSKQCTIHWFNGLSWHTNSAPLVTAGFVTVCCFTSVVNKTSRKPLMLHTFELSFKLKLWAEYLVLISVDYAWPFRPEANSTTVRNSYHLWAACPCLSWSTVAMCALTWVVSLRVPFTLTLCSGNSPSPAAGWHAHETIFVKYNVK